jgi:hypothetical protein
MEDSIDNNTSMKKIYNLNYYNKHKSKILEKAKQIKQCELCGKSCSQSNMNRHKKGKSCINIHISKTSIEYEA